MSNEFHKAFDSNRDGDKDSLRVRIINLAYENPWRTKGDYDQEQKEARERHEMFQLQHKLIIRSQKWTVLAATGAIISALATCSLVYMTYQNFNSKISERSDMVQSVETTSIPSEPNP